MSHTPDKELKELLQDLIDTVIELQNAWHDDEYTHAQFLGEHREVLSDAKAAIQKLYISRAEVLEMINGLEAPSGVDETCLRLTKTELRQKLGADHE